MKIRPEGAAARVVVELREMDQPVHRADITLTAAHQRGGVIFEQGPALGFVQFDHFVHLADARVMRALLID